MRLKKVLSAVIVVVILAAPIVAVAHAQSILDWWRLRGYQPPAPVSQLASQDTMTAYGTHVFYVNHPQLIADVATFRQKCTESEQTIVLGCYHPIQAGIDVYDVQDSRLQGILQVTAAHEMLHAAYDRLSRADKDNVNKLLLDYYNHDLHDQRIIDTMNAYKKSEPNDVVNEMHSVFGTEISDLPTPLVNYYRRYFTNRRAVTSFAQSYQSEFTSRTDKINEYDTQLSALKSRIDTEEANLNAQLTQINSDRARLDSERSSGQVSAYNADVSRFNSEVDSYNAGIKTLQINISAYNSLVATRNALAAEIKSLDQAIDTRLTTQTAQ